MGKPSLELENVWHLGLGRQMESVCLREALTVQRREGAERTRLKESSEAQKNKNILSLINELIHLSTYLAILSSSRPPQEKTKPISSCSELRA